VQLDSKRSSQNQPVACASAHGPARRSGPATAAAQPNKGLVARGRCHLAKRAAPLPRVPGLNLGLGRDFYIPPGPKEARRAREQSWPFKPIGRLSINLGVTKPPAGSHPETLTLISILSFLFSLSRRRPVASEVRPSPGKAPPEMVLMTPRSLVP
jgi:hypothetical protein